MITIEAVIKLLSNLCKTQACHVQLVDSPLLEFKVITFCGHNIKVFKGWRVVPSRDYYNCIAVYSITVYSKTVQKVNLKLLNKPLFSNFIDNSYIVIDLSSCYA